MRSLHPKCDPFYKFNSAKLQTSNVCIQDLRMSSFHTEDIINFNSRHISAKTAEQMPRHHSVLRQRRRHRRRDGQDETNIPPPLPPTTTTFCVEYNEIIRAPSYHKARGSPIHLHIGVTTSLDEAIGGE